MYASFSIQLYVKRPDKCLMCSFKSIDVAGMGKLGQQID